MSQRLKQVAPDSAPPLIHNVYQVATKWASKQKPYVHAVKVMRRAYKHAHSNRFLSHHHEFIKNFHVSTGHFLGRLRPNQYKASAKPSHWRCTRMQARPMEKLELGRRGCFEDLCRTVQETGLHRGQIKSWVLIPSSTPRHLPIVCWSALLLWQLASSLASGNGELLILKTSRI